VQAVAVAASREQETLVAFVVENANVAEVEVVEAGGLESMVTFGGAVTVQEKLADAVTVPDVAFTVKVCAPTVRPL
jgi:hypothetical protein